MTALTCADVRDVAPAYVLGALERDEELAVTEHLESCPDPHREVAELSEVTPFLDESIPLVEPPAGLRIRILAAAADELATRRPHAVAPVEVASAAAIAPDPGAAPVAGAPVPTPLTPALTVLPGRSDGATIDAGLRPAPTTPVVSSRGVVAMPVRSSRPRNLGAWALGLAAVLAIVALGAWNVSTQQQLADARSYQQRLAAALLQAGQPGSQVAVLASTGTPGSGPGGIAVMPANGPGTLVVSGLSPTSGQQVYEAWAIVTGQPPAPVAGFVVGPDGVGYLDHMPTATGEPVTVAITLEPAPNPSAPTSAPIAAGVANPPTDAG